MKKEEENMFYKADADDISIFFTLKQIRSLRVENNNGGEARASPRSR